MLHTGRSWGYYVRFVHIFVILIMYGTTNADLGEATIEPTEKIRAFNEADYEPSSVTKKTYTHGEVGITIIQVKGFKDSPVPGLGGYCRAWLTVQSGNHSIKELYFDDIFPLGGSYGLFVPRKQPTPEYFIVVKLGSYDGRLLLVGKDGTILDLLGGSFFVTPDKKLLFTVYDSDNSGLSVFDLVSHKVRFSSKEVPYVPSWYKNKFGYFFTEYVWEEYTPAPVEKAGIVHVFDLKTNKIIGKGIDIKKVVDAKRIQYDFSSKGYQDCTCNP